MTLTQYYSATSLGGFIADPDNSLEWLFSRKSDEGGPPNYAEFIAATGAMAMGATTYEWIVDHEFPDKDPAGWKWPYDIPCWVFTHRDLPVVPGSGVVFTSADVATVHQEMVAAADGRNIWIVDFACVRFSVVRDAKPGASATLRGTDQGLEQT